MLETSPIICGWCEKEIKEGTRLEWCDHFGKVHGRCLDNLIGDDDYNDPYTGEKIF